MMVARTEFEKRWWQGPELENVAINIFRFSLILFIGLSVLLFIVGQERVANHNHGLVKGMVFFSGLQENIQIHFTKR